jgi:tellurite methyltransferase
MRVLDAGCGGGRNLTYLLRAGYDVFGADRDPDAVRAVRTLASEIAPLLAPGNFRVESVEAMSFPAAFADVVIGSALLHFARDTEQFEAMVAGMWKVLKPGGLLFARLASSIGMEDRLRPLGGRRFLLPDGSERYLVDEPILLELTGRLGASLVDPLKTTIVQDQRCMTTWVLRKPI